MFGCGPTVLQAAAAGCCKNRPRWLHRSVSPQPQPPFCAPRFLCSRCSGSVIPTPSGVGSEGIISAPPLFRAKTIQEPLFRPPRVQICTNLSCYAVFALCGLCSGMFGLCPVVFGVTFSSVRVLFSCACPVDLPCRHRPIRGAAATSK